MSKAYHITQWNPLYEKADTRKTDYMGQTIASRRSWWASASASTMREPYPRNIILLGLSD